jgi:L-lactate utilization protein LutB
MPTKDQRSGLERLVVKRAQLIDAETRMKHAASRAEDWLDTMNNLNRQLQAARKYHEEALQEKGHWQELRDKLTKELRTVQGDLPPVPV